MAAEDVTAEIHGFSEPGSAPTPWVAGLEQLRATDTFWLSTVRPDGRPHVRPLIAVWHAEALWFTTGLEERKCATGRSAIGMPVGRVIVFRVRPGARAGVPQGRSLQPDDLAGLSMSPALTFS